MAGVTRQETLHTSLGTPDYGHQHGRSFTDTRMESGQSRARDRPRDGLGWAGLASARGGSW
ncbi:hypothetical protein CRG98_043901 [Punica granatum]|uniref:Uncharacterized protein n=1 Tax=Punica granatum TaxID=22663 RepID=A0A2I0HVU2_PUNGR|nr:hypothetical protein CRG98_043901 [Punica granatum]